MSNVSLFFIDIGHASPPVDRIVSKLSVEESRRAARFLREVDRAAFVRSHVALRKILARATDQPPQRIQIEAEPFNKPQLVDTRPHAQRIDFSLSHSSHVALVGVVVGGGRIGVDVEVGPPPKDWLDIARRWFAEQEIAELAHLTASQKGDAFLRFWTRKEAYLKATGQGLTGDLNACRCRIDSNGSVESVVHDASGAPGGSWRSIVLDRAPTAACAFIDFAPHSVSVDEFCWRSVVA